MTIKKFHYFENMEIIVSVVGAFLVLIIVLKSRLFKLEKVPRHLIFALLVIKIAGASLLYQHYEAQEERKYADVLKYYDDGLVIKEGLLAHPELGLKLLTKHKVNDVYFTAITENCSHWSSGMLDDNLQGNRLIIRLNAILSLITYQNYFLHLVFFTLLSFSGIIMLLKCLPEECQYLKLPLLIALTITPTMLFWTSGILKESLVVFFLGLFCINAFPSKYSRSHLSRLVFLIVSICALFVLKPYIIFAIFIGFFIYLLHRIVNYSWLKLSVAIVVLLFIVFNVAVQFGQFNPLHEINNKRIEFEELSKTYDAGSAYSIPIVNAPIEIIYKGPLAILNVLFRPHIFEVEKKTYLPFALETAFLLLLTILVILFFRRPTKNLQYMIVPGTFFVLISCLIIGLSIPILGASIRYRSPAIMIYILILFSLIDWIKIKSFIALKKLK